MKVRLLFPDRDAGPNRDAVEHNADLVRDFGLDTILDAMAPGSQELREHVASTLLDPLHDLDAIRHRQDVLGDLLAHPDLATTLYEIAGHAVDSPRRTRLWLFSRDPSSVLRRSVQILAELLGDLHRLRSVCDDYTGRCDSTGLTVFFDTVASALPDEYFPVIEEHLQRLRFPTGVVMTGRIGPGGQGTDWVLRKPVEITPTWRQRLHLAEPDSYLYRLPDRDEAGGRALRELENHGVNLVADALAQSVDHIRNFFAQLRFEMAFYCGCLNLQRALADRGLGLTCPQARPVTQYALRVRGLYDLNLGLRVGRDLVPNDVDADAASLVMITGANQGGKSTVLRALGVAQLLLQCGSFVPALEYRASVTTGLLTHFRREEDADLASGKLDEELARMSSLVDRLRPGAMVLMNESFAATNEREGSEIARQVVTGLRQAGIRVVFVTHLYDLAAALAGQFDPQAVFLRPERLAEGERTFRVVPGEPEPTSYGPDLYRRVFGPSNGHNHTNRREEPCQST